jgi:hypothetical protein
MALGGGTTVTSTVTPQATSSTAQSPYVVTLVVSTGNLFNSTVGDQPSFYALGPKGLESSASVYIPANRLIKMVIINYDEGNASLVIPSDNVVSGTVNGTVFVASNANINSSQGQSGIVVKGGQFMTSVPSAKLAHTFTVPALNLNIPLPVSSTVVAYFTVDKAGNYVWFCETRCGFGPSGTAGAMSTPGWMTGSLVAS